MIPDLPVEEASTQHTTPVSASARLVLLPVRCQLSLAQVCLGWGGPGLYLGICFVLTWLSSAWTWSGLLVLYGPLAL